MYDHFLLLRYSLVILLAALSLTACQKSTQTASEGYSVPGIRVAINDDTCPSVEISINDQVTWVNEDDQEHPIRVESSGEQKDRMFASVDLGPGDATSLTFPEVGRYSYVCSVDEESTGTITVQP